MNKEDFIKNLSSELKPVKINWRPSRRAFLWCALNILLVVAALISHQNFSIDFSDRLIECLVMLSTVATLIYYSFLGIVPGAIERKKHIKGLFAIIGFIAYYLFIELMHLEPKANMVMRSSCDLEIIIMANIPALSLFYFLNKDRENLLSLSPLMGGLACAFIPSMIMNFICSYSLKHMLLYHIIPVVLFGAFFQIMFFLKKKISS